MNKQNITIGIAIIAILIAIGTWFGGNGSANKLGAVTAITHTQSQFDALQGFSVGCQVGLPASDCNKFYSGYGTSSVALFPGTTLVNNLVSYILGFNGGNPTQSTSTTLTAGQFCTGTNDLISGSSANVTTTFPAATSSYALCGGAFGGISSQLVTNDSTNTATFVPGTGMTFKCETNGVGTTTVTGGCTSSLVTINASSVAEVTGYWDTSSSSLVLMWGNEWH